MSTKILVVDDDVDSLKLIGLMLQRQGYEVFAANSGGQAIDKATTNHPDLIILDVMMPDMDGYQVCRHLRNDGRTREIPIIMFTAKTLVDDKVAGFEAGADDYLTKPTHPAELASRVKAVLARSAARKGSSSEPKGLSIAFMGAKGGIGTTTLAINAGALLAARETTILVDFRPGQSSAGLVLGMQRAGGLANVVSRPPAEINARLIEQEMSAHNCGLRLLLSSHRPRETQLNITLESATAVIKSLRAMSRYLLVDLGVGLNRLNAQLVKEVDQLVITVEPNRVSLTMARELLNEVHQISGAANTHIVIINRAPSSLQIPWQEAEHILEHEMTAIISPAPELAFQAAENGVPIVLMQPEATITSQYAKMVEEMHKRVIAQ